MIKLILQSLSKSIANRVLFQDVSFTLEKGDKLAVVGPNGSGKSTLLRLLKGDEVPDTGNIYFSPPKLDIGYCVQDIKQKELSKVLFDWVLEALPSWSDLWYRWQQAQDLGDKKGLEQLSEEQDRLETLYGYHPETRVKSILQGLGFNDSMQQATLSQLSGGWRERSKLAKSLVQGSDILLLDEPTNHLDLEALKWLEEFVIGFKGIIVFVVHERYFLDRVSNHLLYIDERIRPVLHKGNLSSFLQWQEEADKEAQRKVKQIERNIEHKQRFVDRFRYKSSKASLAQSRLKQIQTLEQEKQAVARPSKGKSLNFRWLSPVRSGDIVLSASKLQFSYNAQKDLWPQLSFSLSRGQKIGLLGPNGCGKSTLLKLITGELPAMEGTVRIGSGVRSAYFAQHMSETLREEDLVMREMRRLCKDSRKEEEMKEALGLFLLGSDYWDRKVKALSGGERSRLRLASIFLSGANFLIMDEPTNNLDLQSREVLAQALGEFEGTVFMVAHDRHLLEEAADELWLLNQAGLQSVEHSYLLDAKIGQENSEKTTKDSCLDISGKINHRKEQKKIEAEQRNRLYRTLRPKQKRYQVLEKQLEEMLSKLDEVENKLVDPDTYDSGTDIRETNKEYQRVQRQSEDLINEMEGLEKEIQELQAGRENV
ncbi:MAG TPA: ATP-binding cassette domain-containing protein [Desulfohalobiaceae bacterium]|nr:ATP-binding cassette domain-containing protein [Desulfohalobiaceae bacterium]